MLSFLSIFSLNVPTLDCSPYGGVYNAVLIYSVAPIAVGVLIVLMGILRVLRVPSSAEHKSLVFEQHCWALLTLSFLVLPPTSTKQLQALNCFELSHDGSRYLRQNSAINCDSMEHRSFTDLNVLLITFYMSIPLTWAVLLWNVRHRLLPKGVVDQTLVFEMRDKVTSSTIYTT